MRTIWRLISLLGIAGCSSDGRLLDASPPDIALPPPDLALSSPADAAVSDLLDAGGADLPPDLAGAPCVPFQPSCVDGRKNGGETDIDCGGAACPKCLNGKACNGAGDCVGGVCCNGVCTNISCNEAIFCTSDSNCIRGTTCRLHRCNTISKVCFYTAVADGTPCDDALGACSCDASEVLMNGNCPGDGVKRDRCSKGVCSANYATCPCNNPGDLACSNQPGTTCCGAASGGCANLDTDPKNCGDCGRVCPNGAVCAKGQCCG